jgi:hypothetical protein
MNQVSNRLLNEGSAAKVDLIALVEAIAHLDAACSRQISEMQSTALSASLIRYDLAEWCLRLRREREEISESIAGLSIALDMTEARQSEALRAEQQARPVLERLPAEHRIGAWSRHSMPDPNSLEWIDVCQAMNREGLL